MPARWLCQPALCPVSPERMFTGPLGPRSSSDAEHASERLDAVLCVELLFLQRLGCLLFDGRRMSAPHECLELRFQTAMLLFQVVESRGLSLGHACITFPYQQYTRGQPRAEPDSQPGSCSLWTHPALKAAADRLGIERAAESCVDERLASFFREGGARVNPRLMRYLCAHHHELWP